MLKRIVVGGNYMHRWQILHLGISLHTSGIEKICQKLYCSQLSLFSILPVPVQLDSKQ
jgi:hypothetical protein